MKQCRDRDLPPLAGSDLTCPAVVPRRAYGHGAARGAGVGVGRARTEAVHQSVIRLDLGLLADNGLIFEVVPGPGGERAWTRNPAGREVRAARREIR
jgi:hypothetical protein